MITNAHIHTPWSFCELESIEQIVRKASTEGIAALGINDANTVEGYKDFSESCTRERVYPLFNLEFAVDDDSVKRRSYSLNPRFTCIHGKALKYPTGLCGDSRNMIASIWKASQDRIWKMIDALNRLLQNRHISITLDYNVIRAKYAKQSLLEPHLARALHCEFISFWNSNEERIAMFRRLFKDDSFDCDPSDAACMRREIINRLMAEGKDAYISEQPQAHMDLSQAKQIILQAGGIPCYQCTFNETSNSMFNPEALANGLLEKNIHAIEFIPCHTSHAALSTCMRYFADRHFCVTVGTGNVSDQKNSFIPLTSDGLPLDKQLTNISYSGACILAAHQELHHQKRRGFVDESGNRLVPPEQLEGFIRIGDLAIRRCTAR